MSEQLYSRTAEQSVIGGLMLNNPAIMDVADIVRADDFAEARHQAIYRAMLTLDRDGIPFDVITLAEQLSHHGELDTSGGQAYLGMLARDTPSAANVRHYAHTVRAYAIRRRLLAAANQIGELARDEADAGIALDHAQSLLSTLSEEGATAGPMAAAECLLSYMDELDARVHRGGDLLGVPTGLTSVDRLTNGLAPGRLCVVAARPAMGKSIFGLQCALNVALRVQKPALFATLEMPVTEVLDRVMAAEGEIPLDTVQKAKMDDDQWHAITLQAKSIKQSQLYIDESSRLTINELRARARRLHRRSPLGLVVIDYLQLMSGEGENRTQEIGSISRGLKSLAVELSIPVLALAQLNRSLEGRPNKRPLLADLRESGNIEQDADMAAFLYRDEVYNPDSRDKGCAEFIVRKQRNGRTGTAPLSFRGEYVRFDDLAVGLPSWQEPAEDELKPRRRGFSG